MTQAPPAQRVLRWKWVDSCRGIMQGVNRLNDRVGIDVGTYANSLDFEQTRRCELGLFPLEHV